MLACLLSAPTAAPAFDDSCDPPRFVRLATGEAIVGTYPDLLKVELGGFRTDEKGRVYTYANYCMDCKNESIVNELRMAETWRGFDIKFREGDPTKTRKVGGPHTDVFGGQWNVVLDEQEPSSARAEKLTCEDPGPVCRNCVLRNLSCYVLTPAGSFAGYVIETKPDGTKTISAVRELQWTSEQERQRAVCESQRKSKKEAPARVLKQQESNWGDLFEKGRR